MRRPYIYLRLGSAIVGALAICTSVMANDLLAGDQNVSRAVGVELSIWGQGVVPVDGLDDGEPCSGLGSEFCAGVFGGGASFAIELPFGARWSVIGDGLYDYHEETDENSNDRKFPAAFRSFGVHVVKETEAISWGAFGVALAARNHADRENTGLILGGGTEVRFDRVFAQAGGLFFVDEGGNIYDTIEDLYFLRAGGDLPIGPGLFEASAAVGIGDFDEDEQVSDGLWVQATAEYRAPLIGDLNWFLGYQGDFVRLREPGETEQALFHTIKVGLSYAFGGGITFQTPNFRAPIVNAGEMN